MLIYLLRHGLTAYNAEKRYQGQRDIPLCPAGRAQLRQADLRPETVYITPLCRTRQTAEVLFPGARLVEVKDLQEMCFGSFEGRNFIEMEHDPDYLAWVNANCESPCPDGETKAVFSERVCRAFAALVDRALADGEETLVILAHGGAIWYAWSEYARENWRILARCYRDGQWGEVLTVASGEALFFPRLFTWRGKLHVIWTEQHKGSAAAVLCPLTEAGPGAAETVCEGTTEV